MEHGTAPGDTTGPGHGNLLVLLSACRGLGACRQSLPMYPEPLLSLAACFIALFTVLLCGFIYARCGPRALKAAAVYPLFVLASGL